MTAATKKKPISYNRPTIPAGLAPSSNNLIAQITQGIINSNQGDQSSDILEDNARKYLTRLLSSQRPQEDNQPTDILGYIKKAAEWINTPEGREASSLLFSDSNQARNVYQSGQRIRQNEAALRDEQLKKQQMLGDIASTIYGKDVSREVSAAKNEAQQQIQEQKTRAAIDSLNEKIRNQKEMQQLGFQNQIALSGLRNQNSLENKLAYLAASMSMRGSGGMTDQEFKRVSDLRNRATSSDAYKKANESASAAGIIREALKQKNPILDQTLQVSLNRLVGEVGNLAAQEQSRFKGSKDLKSRVEQGISDLKTGTLTDSNRKLLNQLVDEYEDYNNRRVNKEIYRYMKSGINTGLPEKGVRAAFDPFLKNLPQKNSSYQEGKVYQIKLKDGRTIKAKRVNGGWEAQ